MRLLTLRTILAATDVDRSADAALDSAHRLADLAGAALHVVHVLGSPSGVDADGDAVRAALRRAGISDGDAKPHTIPGAPADTIRALADRLAADVIVVGPHRERSDSAASGPLGSTAHAIVVHAASPCLVTAQPLRLPLRRVLVPIDLSDTARGALLVALSWASGLRAGAAGDRATTLEVLHVDTGDAATGATTSVDRELELVRGSAGDWAGVGVRAVTERGADVAQIVAQRARDLEADLVVLGTRGLGLREATSLGSVSASLVTTLHLPMLLVPPAVWRLHGAMP